MTTETRLEADSIGTMEVPAEAYYGVQAASFSTEFQPIEFFSLSLVR